jgi:hypothetical protein
LDEHLRHAQRVLALSSEVSLLDGKETDREHLRLDPAHPGPAGWRPDAPSPHDRRGTGSSTAGETFGWRVTWTALSLGLAAFACGGVLLGWSIVGQRQELWTIGMPIALVGLVGLLAGLILQLERLWHENRDTAAKLDRVDRQLRELSVGPPAGDEGQFQNIFRAHPAEEMGPMRLLADLKKQLDALSRKLDGTDARADQD